MQTTQRKVFVVGGDRSTVSLFTSRGYANVSNAGSADLICFTGGADVSPSLYEHPRHQFTYSDWQRDEREMAIFEAAIAKGTPMVGICRGGQFLNVMHGGKMYQDVTGHTMHHDLFVGKDNEHLEAVFKVTSTHHQMMMPHESGEILARGTASDVTYYDDGTECWVTQRLEHGIEVVKYNKCICFQPHPEMRMESPEYEEMRKYFFKLIDQLFTV